MYLCLHSSSIRSSWHTGSAKEHAPLSVDSVATLHTGWCTSLSISLHTHNMHFYATLLQITAHVCSNHYRCGVIPMHPTSCLWPLVVCKNRAGRPDVYFVCVTSVSKQERTVTSLCAPGVVVLQNWTVVYQLVVVRFVYTQIQCVVTTGACLECSGLKGVFMWLLLRQCVQNYCNNCDSYHLNSLSFPHAAYPEILLMKLLGTFFLRFWGTSHCSTLSS